MEFPTSILKLVSFLLALGLQLPKIHGEEIIVKPPDVTDDETVICDASPSSTKPDDMKVKIDGEMDYDDLLRLTVWRTKFLRGDYKSNQNPDGNLKRKRKEMRWRLDLVTWAQKKVEKVCPKQFNDYKFLDVVVELFMIYQNSIENATDQMKKWNAIKNGIEKCSGAQSPKFLPSGYELTGFVNAGNNISILPPEELADASPNLDLIIDTIWWMFSFSFGQCYFHNVPEVNDWANSYKRLFNKHLLQPLKSRWLNAGKDTDFGLIFGDFPYKTNIKNLRTCVTSIYTAQGIADRQLVRPLTLAPKELGVEAGLNKKTGKKWNP